MTLKELIEHVTIYAYDIRKTDGYLAVNYNPLSHEIETGEGNRIGEMFYRLPCKHNTNSHYKVYFKILK